MPIDNVTGKTIVSGFRDEDAERRNYQTLEVRGIKGGQEGGHLSEPTKHLRPYAIRMSYTYNALSL